MNTPIRAPPRPSMFARSPPIRIPSPPGPSEVTPPWFRRQSSAQPPSNFSILEEEEPMDESDDQNGNTNARPYFMQKPKEKNPVPKNFLKIPSNEFLKLTLLNATKQTGHEKKCVCNAPQECRLIRIATPRVYTDYTNTEEVFDMEIDDDESVPEDGLSFENRQYMNQF